MPLHDAGSLGVLLDVLTVVEDGPQLAVEGSLVAMVQVADDWLDGLGGFFGVVERNAAIANVSKGIAIFGSFPGRGLFVGWERWELTQTDDAQHGFR